MKSQVDELQALLAGADPVAAAPELPPEDALAIRRAMVSATHGATPARDPWSGAVPIAAVVVVTIAAGVAVGRKLPPPEAPPNPAAPYGVAGERRQLRFATPGGTRIIWTLDPEFELERGMP